MKKNLKHYRVTVLSLKSRRPYQPVEDDMIFMQEGDVFNVYGKDKHEMEKYVDLWFSAYIDKEERDNYITLGRLKRVEDFRKGSGKFYVTKLGRFIVEELPC